jgi:DNA polymerase (family 10)
LDNKEVAAVFAEMADLLQIQGGTGDGATSTDTYRIRAFRRTARVLENLGESVHNLLDRNGLHKVHGLGEGSVHRIKQILRTGSCDDLRSLKAHLPAGLREILELKGVGPRTVRILYSHLRIGTLEELEAAAVTGRLAKLPRMGERTEDRILEAIAAHRKRIGRVRLSKAIATGNAIAQRLREAPDVVRAELTGSARRRKATVGDLDILVAAEDGRPALSAFLSMPDVAEVLWSGEGRCSVRLQTRQQVDMRIIPPENMGAGLHYFTGSQLHNIASRARGNRFQLRISEHGVFRRADDVRLLPAEHEEEIFAAVGLPFIPPELRETVGEIEAAEAGRLPNLVCEQDLRGDLHMHTRASDGKGTAREMAEAAIALGHAYIAITDHTQSLTVANGLDEARLLEQVDHLQRLEQQMGRIRLLTGSEVDILEDGDLDIHPSVLRRLDWVVASIHSHFDLSADEMTARIVRAIESGLVDVIGHPTGRQLGERDGFPFDMERVLRAALRCGVALECNGSPKRMDLDDVGCRQARETGVQVVISTDAHAPAHLAHRQYGLAMARRGWLERKDVLNAWPVEVLRDRRQDRMRRAGVAISLFEPSRPPTTAPHVTRGVEEAELLAEALADPATLDAALLDRIGRYLVEGGDESLEAALLRSSTNPMGRAFEIVLQANATASPGPRGSRS